MVNTIEEFLHYWKYEAEVTTKLFACITNDALEFSIPLFSRNIAFLANHILETLHEMPTTAGLKNITSFESKKTVDEIIIHYNYINKSFIDQLTTQWTNKELLDEIPMYGEVWKKKEVLFYLILHQTHHRGQITVMLKAAGLNNIGIYGQTSAEWAAMGMDPMP